MPAHLTTTFPTSTALNMALVLAAVALLPGMLLATTSFIRFAIVLTFLRNALGTQNMPPTQVLMGLSLFATLGIMAPVLTPLYNQGIAPYLSGRINIEDAASQVVAPLRHFMIRQTRARDLALFYNMAHQQKPKTLKEVKLHLLVPAFIISELKTAFEMGFVVYLPFLLIDIVVATVLMAMGMAMVPPAVIGLPIKIMLFVLADGWNILIGSLIRSFG